MPTYARKHQLTKSLLYHVYNRSNGRKTIFESEADFQRFMGLLREYEQRYPVKIYHWVIMSNHYHLLLKINDPEELPGCMSGIGRAYTHYYNKKKAESGFLWQGRFKSQPVQTEEYAVACGRYIERNPVRAGIVGEALEYAYSSAQFYCAGQNDGIVTKESMWYDDFGFDGVQRQERYRKFLQDFDQEKERQFKEMSAPVGDGWFKKRLVRKNGRLIARRQGRRRKDEGDICSVIDYEQ